MLPIGHEPLNRLVSEIFSIKVAEKQKDTYCHRDTSIDNKSRLKLAAREPIRHSAGEDDVECSFLYSSYLISLTFTE